MSAANILVVGATGRVGQATIQHILSAEGGSEVRVHGGVRSASKASQVERIGAYARPLDLDHQTSVEAAVAGIDRLLLLTGYSVEMIRQSKRILDAAKRAGVTQVVHIGASGHPTSEVAHWGWHRMIEAYIASLGFQFTHLQPEAFMQNLEGFGWLSPGSLTSLIGDARWSWVDARDVGALAGAALLNPDLADAQAIRLGYDAGSMVEVASQLTESLGSKVQVQYGDPDEFYAAAIAAGADPAYIACVRDQFKMNAAGEIADSDQTFDEESFEKLVGRRPTVWADFIHDHRASLALAMGLDEPVGPGSQEADHE